MLLILSKALLVFCALLGIVWAYFLFTHRRGNLSANKYLALLVMALAVLVLRQTISSETFRELQLFLYFISHGFIYLIGPAVYFHIENITGTQTPFRRVWKHFIPGVAIGTFMVVLFIFRVEVRSINNFLFLKIFSSVFVTLQVLHLLSYIFFSRKTVAAYEKRISKYYSSLSRINLNWIRQLMITTFVFAVLILSMYLLIITGGYYEVNNTADFLFLTLTAVIILSMVFKSWKQPEIVSGIYEESDKYRTSPLSVPESNRLKEKLEQLMYREKIYLIPELSLSRLASSMDTQPYILSQLINQRYDQNFFSFINGFRIEFALEKIRKGDLKHTTFTGIAYDSGFNSKSTFNRAFKKKIGCTPKEYCKLLVKNQV